MTFKQSMSGTTHIEDVATFFKKRLKTPKLYAYSATGDLVIKNKDGEVVRTIMMPNYRPPTDEETATLEAEKLDRIGRAQEAFENARRTMRDAVAEGVPGNIRRAMSIVTALDEALHRARYAVEMVKPHKSIMTKLIDFEDPKNEKMVEDVYVFSGRLLTPQETWARVAEAEFTAYNAVAALAAETPSRPVTIISGPDGPVGGLSSWWPVPITYEDGDYKNAYQAIMSEMARTFASPELAETIQDAAGPEEVSYQWSDFEGATEEAWNTRLEALILAINRAKFKQHLELADQLLSTGRRVLGYVNPEDPTDAFQGIGLAAENPAAQNEHAWTGQNVYGRALTAIRKELADAKKALGAPPGGGASAPPNPPNPLTARLKRKPVTSVLTTAASTVGQAAASAAVTVGQAATAATDSLIDLFNPPTTGITSASIPLASSGYNPIGVATARPISAPAIATAIARPPAPLGPRPSLPAAAIARPPVPLPYPSMGARPSLPYPSMGARPPAPTPVYQPIGPQNPVNAPD
uniref:NADAR domain-containing protein n=1 Tax=viral metagenome TaxID=1070528 RepID=A0A6C0DGX4_9ZZZZ